MTRSFTWFENIIVRFFLLAMAGWGTLAILYSNLPAPLRPLTAALFGVGSLVAIVGRYRPLLSRLGFLAAFAAVLVWWLIMPPSNSRNWQPDVAVLPWAEIRGTRVILHNIRNCDYRSETDYTVRHYDRTFDLTKLKSVDLALVHWGAPYIAHTMLSFEFDGDGVVTFSVETRKEIGEEYSNFKGFFRQYELTYVVADERDLIGLRANYRHEQVYLYRLHESADLARRVFLDYLQKVNSLKEQPQWYNALTGNCTTSFRISKAPYNPDTLLDWRLIANGFIDEMLYERGAIDTSMPFQELKKRSLINERAKMVNKSQDFSKRIRIGLPGMEQ